MSSADHTMRKKPNQDISGTSNQRTQPRHPPAVRHFLGYWNHMLSELGFVPEVASQCNAEVPISAVQLQEITRGITPSYILRPSQHLATHAPIGLRKCSFKLQRREYRLLAPSKNCCFVANNQPFLGYLGHDSTTTKASAAGCFWGSDDLNHTLGIVRHLLVNKFTAPDRYTFEDEVPVYCNFLVFGPANDIQR